MTAHAATRTGGAGGPGLTGRKPGRQLRTVMSLAVTEASLLIRSVLVLAGLVVGGVVVWRFIWPVEPLWWNAAWKIGYAQVILAATVLVTKAPRPMARAAVRKFLRASPDESLVIVVLPLGW